MNWHDYIVADASVLTGKPVIRGTRLSVEFIVNLLAEGWSEEEVLRNYPGLKREHIRACLAYARDLLGEERIFPVPHQRENAVRLCANENVPGDCVALLRSRGHDVLWIHQSHPGLGDDSVLEKALTESRLLITFDKDFGELVFHKGADASCGIVLFRISMPSPDAAAKKVVTSLESRSDWANQFSVVDDAMVRMRPLPD